jgi:hypothetical protein
LRGTWPRRTAGTYQLNVTEAEVVLSAAIVGLPLLISDPTQERPLLEMLWRVLMATTNLSPTASGAAWTRSAAYDRLDPSEKVAVSYFLGMLQSELVATGLLGYTHLVHVDRLLLLAGKTLSGKRPDFLALQFDSAGTRIYAATVESKGRTNRFDQGALETAKKQAQATPSIQGLTPREAIASESSFDRADVWTSALLDPDWDGEFLNMGTDIFLLAYYGPVIDAGRESGSARETNNRFEFMVPGLPLTISLPKEIATAVDRARSLRPEQRVDSSLLTDAYWHARGNASGPSRGDMFRASFERDEDSGRLFRRK